MNHLARAGVGALHELGGSRQVSDGGTVGPGASATGPAGVTGSNNSSGHESTSEDEAFVSFRSQVSKRLSSCEV